MAAAEVGDDVFGDDPTVNLLQDRAAEIFEKEAALFVPTGCMGNEIAVKVHTKPGQEIVTEDRGHILKALPGLEEDATKPLTGRVAELGIASELDNDTRRWFLERIEKCKFMNK